MLNDIDLIKKNNANSIAIVPCALYIAVILKQYLQAVKVLIFDKKLELT